MVLFLATQPPGANATRLAALPELADERRIESGHQVTQRRQGVARRLIEWLLASAQVAGIERLHLELRADNEGARAFYRRLGFVDAGVVAGYYDGRIPAQRMTLLLRELQP